jgi:protoporphyrin/coproporphyrin ferrochelatase
LRRVLAVVTSAYPCYSSCRQYRENLYDAASGTTVQIDRIRHYANHPGFVAASVAATLAALQRLGEQAGAARLVFVTHSIPLSMAETAGPEPRTSSGPPDSPWLGPDVNDHLRVLHSQGVTAVVLVPIGFVSDHMEVIFDLDTEAAATAAELGLACERAATAGVQPTFVAGLVDLMLERAAAARGENPDRPVAGPAVAGWYECPPGCCPNLRDPDRPALIQARG